ncbi:MAG: hypothetical protein U1F76_08440 [Candidatus Competibacteraceae bacterium]
MTTQQILCLNFLTESRILQNRWSLRKTLIFVFSVLLLYCSGDFVANASNFDCGVNITINVTKGNPDIVSGKVIGINPAQVWVVVFVQTNNWYIQPFADSRAYIPVNPDGTYQTWIRAWQQISAFVVRKGYNVLQQQQIYKPFPLGVDCKNVVAIDAYPKLRFSNYEWAIKAGDNLGPGPNNFSASPDNVWVDSQGYLHLKITHRNNTWYSAEVYLMRSLGYRKYIFYLASPVDTLDKNVVGSPFLFNDLTHELDIEFSRWGDDNTACHIPLCNAQFVVQPYDKPNHRERFYIPPLEGTLSTHIINWQPGSVFFQSAQGHDPDPSPAQIIHQLNYTGEDIPTEDGELVHLNLWLYRKPPSDGKEAEMIIAAFQDRLDADPPRPDGPEFRANNYTPGDQTNPAVAMGAAGDFVVTWQSSGQDGSGAGIYAQRYTAAAVPQGAEFKVNTTTSDDQTNPAIAMDATGAFVVTWQSSGQDGSGGGIYAQRYTAAGVPQGAEFQVNTTTSGDQTNPAIAMNATGAFVVTWQSSGQDGSGAGIYAQRYSAAAVSQGAEFQVNTTTSGDQTNPAVAMNTSGAFVVTWQSSGQDGSGAGIYAQRYSAAAVSQGTEFKVNTTISSDQINPAMAIDTDGDFIVTWTSNGQDGSGEGIYAQRYTPVGTAKGTEFRVNTYALGDQGYPAMAMDSAGDFVVTWESNGQDDSGYGIYAQRYAVNNYNAAFNPPVLSGKSYNPTPVPEGPAGVFSFTAHFCNDHHSAYPLSGLASRTITLTNNNCLLNRDYGPTGTPSGAVSPCGVDSVLDFPATGGYSDYALAVGECVDVTYQIGLQQRKGFSFFVDVGGM